MKIKKGEVMRIRSNTKGVFMGEAVRDFDTSAQWWPIKVAKGNGTAFGMAEDWEEGDEIPCRGEFYRILPKVKD